MKYGAGYGSGNPMKKMASKAGIDPMKRSTGNGGKGGAKGGPKKPKPKKGR